jgi:hypothetical protein
MIAYGAWSTTGGLPSRVFVAPADGVEMSRMIEPPGARHVVLRWGADVVERWQTARVHPLVRPRPDGRGDCSTRWQRAVHAQTATAESGRQTLQAR